MISTSELSIHNTAHHTTQQAAPRGSNGARVAYGLFWLIVLVTVLMPIKTLADPLAPSLLEMLETSQDHYDVRWQTPQRLPLSNPLPLQPQLPEHCEPLSQVVQRPASDARSIVSSWQVSCKGGIDGQRIAIENLSSRSANTLLRLEFADGRLHTSFLTPEQNYLLVPAEQSVLQIFMQYLVFGIEHLLIGLDHILFLFTLILLSGFSRELLITVTLFTLAHSITLAMTALGIIDFPVEIAEVFIALSISYTCAIYIKQRQAGKQPAAGQRGPTVWLAAFGFGLLHGLGFASVLLDLGLPQGEVPAALLAFNIGIELGQLLLIGLLMLLWWGIRKLPFTAWRQPLVEGDASAASSAGSLQTAVLWAAFAVGSLAAIWFWQRLALALGF